MPSKFHGFPIIAAVVIVAVVVAACVIRLRDDEGQAQSNASIGIGTPPDQLAEKLERCLSITHEQKNEYGECQKIWAEKRRQFLGQKSGSPARSDQLDASGLSLTYQGNDQSRAPSGNPTPARE